jgi:uncharacterized YccA/Bax inhibitor family protein
VDDLVKIAGLFGISAFVVALVTCFRTSLAKYTAPLYAMFEGLMLGSLWMLINTNHNGIAMQAIELVWGVFGAMVFKYRTSIIKVNERFVIGLFAATLGIGIVYLISLCCHVFGWFELGFLNDSSGFCIGCSLFMVAIAALNLVVDFHYIVKLSRPVSIGIWTGMPLLG